MRLLFYVIALILIISCSSINVTALSGSIGNARAVLNYKLDAGDVIVEDRAIKVSNVNDQSIDVELRVSESIKGIIELTDKQFSLAPGEEKEAAYRIKIKKAGNYDGTINVYFKPQDQGTGVVLASRLVIIVNGNGDFSNIENDLVVVDNTIIDDNLPVNNSDSILNHNPPKQEGEDGNGEGVSVSSSKGAAISDDGSVASPFMGAFIVLVIIVIGLFVFYAVRKKGRKRKKNE